MRSCFTAVVLGAALLAPAPALAQAGPSYPEPAGPGTVAPRPAGKHRTHTVCRRGCDFKRIQAAVDRARAGDTIRVRAGVYREAVRVRGRKKRYLRLIGNPRAPRKVVLAGGGRRLNGVLVDGADQVLVRGFKARDYTANGFFFVNVVGYTARNLIAQHDGVYGIYAFNSKGGTMRDSEAYYHSDAGFYIGQTPAQVRPMRSIVRNVSSWGNPIGFSGTNMRYVTITASRFYNNAAGIIPNALDEERFPPEEENVIASNEIFWNNFDFHAGAPFKARKSGVVPLIPVGTGIALLGGRRNRIEGNRIYGNYTVGAAMIEGFLLMKNPAARDLVANTLAGNALGLGGTDRNGRDLAYDGNGRGNCVGANAGVEVMLPADGSTFATCPFDGANAFNPGVLAEMSTFLGEKAVAKWIRHPHAPKPGYTPLEVYHPPARAAAAPQRKTVKVYDNYYLPAKLKVNKGSTVTWKWPDDEAGDVHDVKLTAAPRGVRKWRSEPASSGYRFKRRLRVPGTYRIVCTLHAEMTMTIKVRRR